MPSFFSSVLHEQELKENASHEVNWVTRFFFSDKWVNIPPRYFFLTLSKHSLQFERQGLHTSPCRGQGPQTSGLYEIFLHRQGYSQWEDWDHLSSIFVDSCWLRLWRVSDSRAYKKTNPSFRFLSALAVQCRARLQPSYCRYGGPHTQRLIGPSGLKSVSIIKSYKSVNKVPGNFSAY